MKKKINARDLISKIEKLAKARMASQEVVSLENFRELKRKVDPPVVYIIEDDETMRASMKRILEQDGYIVRLAADGTELSLALEDVSPDLIILDIGLPWLNGFELGQMLKEHRELKKIPLLFVSGQTSEEDIKKAFEVGADDFIKKPFDIDRFRHTVDTLLKIQRD